MQVKRHLEHPRCDFSVYFVGVVIVGAAMFFAFCVTKAAASRAAIVALRMHQLSLRLSRFLFSAAR